MIKYLCLVSLIGLALGGAVKHRLSLPNLKIVGGQETVIEDHPYQLSLLWYGSHICGATLIAENWALTSAVCTIGSAASEFQVRANSSILEEGGQLITVKATYEHPNFDYDNIDYDIAILELAEPVIITEGAAPIELVEANSTLAGGENATITGWGSTDEGNYFMNKQLKVINVPVVNQTVCEHEYWLEITDRMFCAGLTEGGEDACLGDSGGPLVVDGKLAGLVSWGRGCARAGYPGVYSNIAVLRDFVTEITGI